MKLTPRHERLLAKTFLDYRATPDFVELPLVVERAAGLRYWDIEGRRYFDAIGGIFVAVLGHGHPRVIEAVRRQLDRMTFAPPLHGIAEITLEFIDRLGQVAPPGLDYVKPFSGGSESIEAALKFTRQYFKQSGRPQKHKFISVYRGYHGGTFGAMAASGTGRRTTKFEPLPGGFLKVMPPLAYRDRFASWDEANRFCARLFEDVIVHEDPETIAAVVIEPISNTGGINTPTVEYFQLLRDICDRYGVLLIFDEIITGYARTGGMFCAQAIGVTPDVICGGKGLSSGAVPLGAMIARGDLAQAFLGAAAEERNFAHGHTFSGNPLAAAAGLAVIDEIVERGLIERARTLGEYLATRLEGLEHLGCIREVRGRGMLRGVELAEDPASGRAFPPERKLGATLRRTALANGLIMRIDPDWFAVAPALIATEADLDEMIGLIEKSLVEALALLGRQN